MRYWRDRERKNAGEKNMDRERNWGKRERQERENKKREWLKCFSSLSLVSAGTKGWISTREKILNIIPNQQCTD